ncbi:MAG TPA: hypothetical protein VMR52_09570 [Dehalococcoidia bacterium]|nr:hypothetical protein [Dehalococcoidia bacterium]
MLAEVFDVLVLIAFDFRVTLANGVADLLEAAVFAKLLELGVPVEGQQRPGEAPRPSFALR